MIPPFLEDQDYREWKNWHQLLDRQDENERYKKVDEFKALSEELSGVYVEGLRIMDILRWQKVCSYASVNLPFLISYIRKFMM